MNFQEMDLDTLWASEPDHDWMVGDCPDKKCSDWYKLHNLWLNEVNHRFHITHDALCRTEDNEARLEKLVKEKDERIKHLETMVVQQQEYSKDYADIIQEYEARLAKAQELPEKWRMIYHLYSTQEEYWMAKGSKSAYDCNADELEEALGRPQSEGK